MNANELKQQELYVDQVGNVYQYEGSGGEYTYSFTMMLFNPVKMSYTCSDMTLLFNKFDILTLKPLVEGGVPQPDIDWPIEDILEEFAKAIKLKARPMDDYYSKYKGTYNAIDEDDVDEILKQFKEKYTK